MTPPPRVAAPTKADMAIAGMRRSSDFALKHVGLMALQRVLDNFGMDVAKLTAARRNDFDHLCAHMAWVEAAPLVADQAIGHHAHPVLLRKIDGVVQPAESSLGHRLVEAREKVATH